jgi:hypothetical protein
MNTRIPPSLNWLIGKHARIEGQICKVQVQITKHKEVLAKLEAKISDLKGLENKLAELQTDIVCIERALSMHEIRIHTEHIAPVAPRARRIDLPYGELTSSLLSFLKENVGKPLSINELTLMTVHRFPHLLAGGERSFHFIRNRIRARLNNLEDLGLAERINPSPPKKSSRWSLPKARPLP